MVAIVFVIGLMSCGSSSRSDPRQRDCDSCFTYLSDRYGICPAPNMQPPGWVTQPRRVMWLIKTSLQVFPWPSHLLCTLFCCSVLTTPPYTGSHFLSSLPLIALGGAPSTTAVVHKLLFRPASSGEPGLKHDQVAGWVQVSMISVR